MTLWPRAATRRLAERLRDEDGMSLVELLMASFILFVGLMAVLGVVVNAVVTSNRTRSVDLATQMGTEQIERYRGIQYEQVALDEDDYSGSPNHDGRPVVTQEGCDPDSTDTITCPLHEEELTQDGRSFTITRWVLGVDDPSDGTGSSDADGETVDYKRVIVDLAWELPQPGSHSIETNIRQDEVTPHDDTQGVHFEVYRGNTAPPESELLDEDDDTLVFPVTVSGAAGTFENETIEGTGDVLGIPDGAYMCTVEQANADWHPQDNPGATEWSTTCTVNEGDVTAVTSSWIKDICVPAAGTEPATVTVEDSDGEAVTGQDVTLQPVEEGSQTTATTNDSGVASWSAVEGGLYDITIEGDAVGRLCVDDDTNDATTVYDPDADDTTEDPETGEETCESGKATLKATITNEKDEGHHFRLHFEPEEGDKFPRPSPQDNAAGWGVPAGETKTFTVTVTAVEYKKIEIQRRKEDDKWDKKEEWKENEEWEKDVPWEACETYEFSAEVD